MIGEDVDCDGVVDDGESDPLKWDTDGGGINDGLEVKLGYDALDATDDSEIESSYNDPNGDIDQDGLSNREEDLNLNQVQDTFYGMYFTGGKETDWLDGDSDDDGIDDGIENPMDDVDSDGYRDRLVYWYNFYWHSEGEHVTIISLRNERGYWLYPENGLNAWIYSQIFVSVYYFTAIQKSILFYFYQTSLINRLVSVYTFIIFIYQLKFNILNSLFLE